MLTGLAESWEIAPDGLSWVFNLRDGVTFHDGTAFSSEDVAFSFERAMADDSTNAQKSLFDGINSVNVIDDTTVEIGLDAAEGLAPVQSRLGGRGHRLPVTADGNKTRPVGTGPFMFSNWVQGDRVELVKYPGYWSEPAKLDAVTFRFISDPTAAYAALMAGDTDAYPVFPAPENLAQFAADPRFSVIVGTTEGVDDPGDEQRAAAVRRYPRARGRGPYHRPRRDHRRRDVRLWHADRQPFRAAQPGL